MSSGSKGGFEATGLRGGALDLHDVRDEDTGRDDGLGVQLAQLDDLVHGGHGALGGGGHHGAEVAGGLSEAEVAPAVPALGLDEGHIAMDGVLQHIGLAVDDAGLLGAAVGVLGQFSSEAGGGEEGPHAGTGGAQALGQIALGHQLQFDLSAPVELVKHKGVSLAREAADDLAHASSPEKRGEACIAVAGVVVDHGELMRALLNQSVNEFVRDACGTEATDQNRGAISRAL